MAVRSPGAESIPAAYWAGRGTMSAGCFEIVPPYRSKGIAAALLNSVCGGAMQEGSESEIKEHDEKR